MLSSVVLPFGISALHNLLVKAVCSPFIQPHYRYAKYDHSASRRISYIHGRFGSVIYFHYVGQYNLASISFTDTSINSIFIEILRKNAVTGRLWFEISWVGLFWVMELCMSSSSRLFLCVPYSTSYSRSYCSFCYDSQFLVCPV
jgi:hypothetical protein